MRYFLIFNFKIMFKKSFLIRVMCIGFGASLLVSCNDESLDIEPKEQEQLSPQTLEQDVSDVAPTSSARVGNTLLPGVHETWKKPGKSTFFRLNEGTGKMELVDSDSGDVTASYTITGEDDNYIYARIYLNLNMRFPISRQGVAINLEMRNGTGPYWIHTEGAIYYPAAVMRGQAFQVTKDRDKFAGKITFNGGTVDVSNRFSESNGTSGLRLTPLASAVSGEYKVEVNKKNRVSTGEPRNPFVTIDITVDTVTFFVL